MNTLVVVNNPKDWPLRWPGVQVVAARAYITQPEYSTRGLRVINMCRSFRYQSTGYYVSLLAVARGQKPLPAIGTIQDFKAPILARIASEDMEKLLQKSLAPIHSPSFTLSIYFGRNVAKRHDPLAQRLFKLYPAPLLRAQFQREEKNGWVIQSIRPISPYDVPEEHWPYVDEFAREFLGRKHEPRSRPSRAIYDLAILHDPAERYPPSTPKALQRFERAAERLGFSVEFINRDDFSRLAEYDALFIRETTAVNHHTFRFARRAAAENLVVIDDPQSILLCTNKVYLAELLQRHRVRTPKTLIVHRDNWEEIPATIGLPCILKQPDSAFSLGVFKADTPAELEERIRPLLEKSDLIIAQEFLPTPFDWRIGIVDRQPLFACRYFMSRNHWQIQQTVSSTKTNFGTVETIDISDAPKEVVETALRAANLIGDGLYGVDLKQVGDKIYVMEVNDNPSIDDGVEDTILKDKLYSRIMETFLQRIETRKKRSM